MTRDEKRMLVQTERRLSELERKYASMCEVFEILVARRAGRPSKADIARLEELQARMHGSFN